MCIGEAATFFSSIGKLYKTQIICVSVQMGMSHDQDYNLDFGMYSQSNLPTVHRSTHSQMVPEWEG